MSFLLQNDNLLVTGFILRLPVRSKGISIHNQELIHTTRNHDNSKGKKNWRMKYKEDNVQSIDSKETTSTMVSSNQVTTTKGVIVEETDKEEEYTIHPKKKEEEGHSNEIFRIVPPFLQNFVRDSGSLRFLLNFLTRTIAAPVFYYENPYCFPEFIRISEYPHVLSTIVRKLFRWIVVRDNHDHPFEDKLIDSSTRISFHKEQYGIHSKQTADVMIKEDLLKQITKESPPDDEIPLFFFFHGGAWGSGFPTMYRLLSKPFLQRNYRAIILAYRTFPDGGMEDQVNDLTDAITYFTNKYGYGSREKKDTTNNVVLMGHSSGAHISMLAALKGKLRGKIDALICMSGVYDLDEARRRETQQNLTHISPMIPALLYGFNNDDTKEERTSTLLKSYSPEWLIKTKCNKNNNSNMVEDLPPILLLHGENDTVAPPEYSISFYETFTHNKPYNKKCQLSIIDDLDHQDTVLDVCLNKGKTQSIIFQWLNEIKSESDRETLQQ